MKNGMYLNINVKDVEKFSIKILNRVNKENEINLKNKRNEIY
jgi:hypothetical protein